MVKDAGEPESLLPLPPAVFHILLSLSEGDRHGYGVMQEVARMTEGKLRLGPATLYRSLHRLLVDGLIAEVEERPDGAVDDERRRYYKLTPFGAEVAEAEARRLANLVRLAQARQLLMDF